MLDTIGKRLKCCRAATGTSTNDVVEYIRSQGGDISYATYTRWESGTSFPAKKIHLLENIADFFKKNDLQVESQWILTGEGFPPQFAAFTKLDEDTLFILASRSIENVELIQIAGMYGEPYVSFGEFCIVSNENKIEDNNNKLCYIRHENGVKVGVLNILDEKAVLIPGEENLILEKIKIVECRKVKWIQKK